MFNEQPILGLWVTGGFVTPTLHNSLLLMFMRTLLVVPLMASLAQVLYPSSWVEIQKLRQPNQRSLLIQSIAGGTLMFLYLSLLYISLGTIPAGVSMALFFTYPVFTALISWRIFGDRPTLLHCLVMVLVLVGSALTLPHIDAGTNANDWLGIITGLASGASYAVYTIVAQKSFQTFHPVPYTWISFTTTLVLSGLCLVFWPLETTQLPWAALWIGALLSAIVTFGGHLLNNLGIRLIGATTASMIGASNPALTAVLAWFAIQEQISPLQMVGVAVVTLSVLLLSQVRKPAKQ